MVVPDGMLFGNKVSARIKHALLRQFNLHTIVRLPRGVFLPYTAISANLLFFDSSGPTREIWYYEQPLPHGRRYTKTRPIQDADLAECRAWWSQRVENERAWRVPVSEVLRTDEGHLSVNLDVKNPHREPEPEQLPPRAVLANLLGKEKKIVSLLHELEPLLEPGR
jgi:type I restriction enzyme M protein